jgi:hypothetical protein
MAVYVDDIQVCVPNERWKWKEFCHLTADSVRELLAFADKLGLKRFWFQDDPRLPHFDLTPGMRAKAIRYGAQEVDFKFMVEMMKKNKAEKQK